MLAMIPDPDDALPKLMGVLDLPVDPIAMLRVRCNEHDNCACPFDTRGEDLAFDIIGIPRVVGFVAIDGTIARRAAIFGEKILQWLQPRVILVDMADEYIADFITHGRSLPSQRFVHIMFL